MQRLNLHEVATKVSNRKDLHNACIRNGYRVPSLNARICTLEFLNEVRTKVLYVPKLSDVRLYPCPDLPCELEIRQALIEVINGGVFQLAQQDQGPYLRLLSHLEKHTADKNFMIDVIGTLTQGTHKFFKKDFKPAPRKHAFIDPMLQVDNSDGFFDNLPDSKSKKFHCQPRYMLTKEQKEQHRLAQLQKKASEAQQKLNLYQQSMNVAQQNNPPVQVQNAQPMPQQMADPNMMPQHRAQQIPQQMPQPQMMQQQFNHPFQLVEEQKDDPKIEEVEMNQSPSRQIGRDISNLSLQGQQNGRHRARNAKVQALAEYGIHPNVIRNESQ